MFAHCYIFDDLWAVLEEDGQHSQLNSNTPYHIKHGPFWACHARKVPFFLATINVVLICLMGVGAGVGLPNEAAGTVNVVQGHPKAANGPELRVDNGDRVVVRGEELRNKRAAVHILQPRPWGDGVHLKGPWMLVAGELRNTPVAWRASPFVPTFPHHSFEGRIKGQGPGKWVGGGEAERCWVDPFMPYNYVILPPEKAPKSSAMVGVVPADEMRLRPDW